MPRKMFPGRGTVLNQIADTLREIGYSASFLKNVVPEWWSPESEAVPGALAELKVSLAQRLGLDIERLLVDGKPVPVPPSGVCFKRSTNQLIPSIDATLSFCGAVAQSVAATLPPSRPLPADGDTVRAEILADANIPYVSLESLLSYCWAHNIAVLHIDDFPIKRKGMDAMTLRTDDRDVIIVARDTQIPAWAAFDVAHELGHLALGHVGNNEALLDEEQTDSGVYADTERSADFFALAAIGGSGLRDFWTRHDASPRDLALAVEKRSPNYQVDPAHVLLRYGFARDWKVAHAALKLMNPDAVDSSSVINSIAIDHLDLDAIENDVGEIINTFLRIA